MIGLNHVLTGSAIGIAIQEPLLVAPLAFASHFILDATPHFGGTPAYEYGHRHFPKIMIIDGVLSLIAVLWAISFAPQFVWAIGIGTFFAILPDAFWLHYYKTGKPQYWFYRFHSKIQWFERPPGAIVEVSYCIFICTIIVALLITNS